MQVLQVKFKSGPLLLLPDAISDMAITWNRNWEIYSFAERIYEIQTVLNPWAFPSLAIREILTWPVLLAIVLEMKKKEKSNFIIVRESERKICLLFLLSELKLTIIVQYLFLYVKETFLQTFLDLKISKHPKNVNEHPESEISADNSQNLRPLSFWI